MKKWFVILTLAVFSIGCSKNDNSLNLGNNDISSFLMNSNGLRISEFIEYGENKTAYFSSYTFTFTGDGNVIASNSNGSINGTYLVFRDDGRWELRIIFPINYPFNELTDDWYFIEIDNNIIKFSEGTDVLQFQKL